jgi:hypothetical protein
VRPVENDDIASFPFERRHATPQESVERHPGKAYIRMGIVLGMVKGRDVSERLVTRQRGTHKRQPDQVTTEADDGAVATDFKIERQAQDRMALASQLKAVAAQQSGFFDAEITAVTIAQKKGDPIVVTKDEHPRETSMDALAKLKGVVRPDGTVTAGNASGVNDGACALLVANEASAARHGLAPRARVVGMATAGVAPRIMGFGPAPAVRRCSSWPASPWRKWTSSNSMKRSLRKALQCCATSASLTTMCASTRTAARSRLATRSARAGLGLSPPRSINCIAPGAATRCARCASESDKALR